MAQRKPRTDARRAAALGAGATGACVAARPGARRGVPAGEAPRLSFTGSPRGRTEPRVARSTEVAVSVTASARADLWATPATTSP